VRITRESALVSIASTLLCLDRQNGEPINTQAIDEMVIAVGETVGAAPHQKVAACLELHRRFGVRP
jgi:hypothetical protein